MDQIKVEQVMEKDRQEFMKYLDDSKWKNVPSSIKLLLNPRKYAEEAIVELNRQLQTIKSSKRRSRIESKIKVWEKALEVLNSPK